MPNLLRNVFALLAGIAIGGGVNMALITLSPWLVPPPAGVDVSSAESLSKAMHLFEPRHFIMPFLAHALGTLVGALAAYLIAATHKAQMAYLIGALFLCGGVAASFMIPAPTWFIALDLLAAYLPMAWLGIQMVSYEPREQWRTEKRGLTIRSSRPLLACGLQRWLTSNVSSPKEQSFRGPTLLGG